MAEIPQKQDFLTEKVPRTVKQFVRKYYITWLLELTNTDLGMTCER